MHNAGLLDYSPPFFLFNNHLETIYPALIRKVKLPPFTTERISTPDDDFLDLYWITQNSRKAVVISHGLEGNALRPYMMGMAKACFQNGYDVLLWNFRGCGKEMNRQLRFYHSGATDDLDVIVNHVLKKSYQEISLIGFSLGGNMTLKYLGEHKLPSVLRSAVTFSVPMDLLTSCQQISKPANRIYANRFLKSLKNKVITKAKNRKELDTAGIDSLKTIMDFDDRYTAPLHGFSNAGHYYKECSAIRYLHNITVPTLIVNAQNDPFLSPECYPIKTLRNHAFIKFESPSRGGHVGFTQFGKNGLYWSEERAVYFLSHQ